MKIFFAIKNLSSSVGGAERVLCDIACKLVNRGHEITIITFDKENSNSLLFQVYEYHLNLLILNSIISLFCETFRGHFW